MNPFNKNQFIIIYAIVFVVAVSFFILAFFIFQPNSNSSQTPTITPSISPQIDSSNTPAQSSEDPYSPAYKESVKQIHTEEQPLLDHDKKVSSFISSLPVVGTYFTAKYDIATNTVTVTIDATNKTAGNQEFISYLKKNGIEDTSWIQHLTIRYRDTSSEIQ